jgi:hypothetical protein
VCLALTIIAAMSGCFKPYQLQSRVIHGPVSAMYFVPADSSELDGMGIEGVQYTVYRDPDSLGRKRAGTGRSGPGGDGIIEIRGFGTGHLQEEWLFQAVRSGYETAQLQAPLPSRGRGQVLLIVLRPGTSIQPIDPSEDAMRDYERYR